VVADAAATYAHAHPYSDAVSVSVSDGPDVVARRDVDAHCSRLANALAHGVAPNADAHSRSPYANGDAVAAAASAGAGQPPRAMVYSNPVPL
jgi:hypothetical protein